MSELKKSVSEGGGALMPKSDDLKLAEGRLAWMDAYPDLRDAYLASQSAAPEHRTYRLRDGSHGNYRAALLEALQHWEHQSEQALRKIRETQKELERIAALPETDPEVHSLSRYRACGKNDTLTAR